MKKLSFLIVAVAFLASTPLVGYYGCEGDLTTQIPVLSREGSQTTHAEFEVVKSVAQQKDADWSQVVGIIHNVDVEDAKSIATAHPEVTFFFYAYKDMVLEIGGSTCSYRLIRAGDAVFFSGEPTWGSAYGTGYIKK